MSYQQFMAARQLMAEERIGTTLREQQREEDAKITRLRAKVG